MKKRIILILFIFLFNIIWVNAISITNNLMENHNFVIKTGKKVNLNNNIIEDLDVLLETNLTYNEESADIIGNKIDIYLQNELDGYGELIAKYSIINEVDPYLIASMIIEATNCDSECSVLVKKCNNVSKLKYDYDNLNQISCFGGIYQKFNSLDDSIKSFIKFVKVNFYANELTTPGSIYKSYNKDVRWAFIVNQYINKIKNSVSE